MQTLQLKPVLPDVAPKWHDSRNMNLKRLLQSGITGLRFRTRPWARAVVVKFGDGSAIQLHILLLLDTYTFMLHMPWDLPSERNVIGGLRWLFPFPDLKNKRLNVILWKILDEIQQGNAAKCVSSWANSTFEEKKAPKEAKKKKSAFKLLWRHYTLSEFSKSWFLNVWSPYDAQRISFILR